MSTAIERFAPLVIAGWPVIAWEYIDGAKAPRVSGFHGAKNGRRPEAVAPRDTIKGWCRTYPDANPGLVMPRNVVGFDIDSAEEHPTSGKKAVDGLVSMAEFEQRYGPVPDDVRVFHGYDADGFPSPYGTRLCRIPDSVVAEFEPGRVPDDAVGGNVDLITWWMRYQAAPGSIHKSGDVYEWAVGGEASGITPKPEDLPMLTEEQARALLKPKRAVSPKRAIATGPKTLEAPAEVTTSTLSPADRGKVLLRQTKALAALKEGETLLIKGEQRGWQRGNGFYVLACDLVHAALEAGRDLDVIGAKFAHAAGAYTDAERQWENAVNAVTAEVEADEALYGAPTTAYPHSLTVAPSLFAADLLVREFTTDDALTLRHFDGTFWLWEHGRFLPIDPDDMGALLTSKMRNVRQTNTDGTTSPVVWKRSTKMELTDALKDQARDSRYGLGGALLPIDGGVPFRNGYLDVRTGSLSPIGPERKVQWVIDADYDPAAECPEWEAFLLSCGFGPHSNEYRLLRQWFGYLLSGSKRFEKGLLLIGKSRAGKGITIRIAEALFGGVGRYGGAMAVEAQTLLESHGYEGMPGKGLVTLPETRFTGGGSRGVNARLLSLTANDSVRINPKNKTPFSTNLACRVMIGTNETPHFVEATDALARRLLPIRFTISHADNPDLDLFDRLIAELPGIARWALAGLADLDAEGRFSETDAGREITDMIVEGGSYMHEFLADCFDRVPDGTVTNREMHRVYREWRNETDAPPMGTVNLSQRFTDTYPDIERFRNNQNRGRRGLRIKPRWAKLLTMIYGDEA